MTKPSPPKEISELSEFLSELSEFLNEKFDEIYDRIENLENSNNIVIEFNVSFSGVGEEKYSWKKKHAPRSFFQQSKEGQGEYR